MNHSSLCRCCLARTPDKDVKTPYTSLGRAENYGDMLKECFEIHLALDGVADDDGICNLCVTRLRDAVDFKEQVLRCQKELQLRLISSFNVKDEVSSKVKLEVSDAEDESGVYFLELKQELSEDETKVKEDEDLAAILGLEDTLKKKVCKKNGKKTLLDSNELKGARVTSKLSYTLTQMEKLKRPKPTRVRFISERTKHRANLDNILKHSNCTPFSNMTLAGVSCAYCKQIYRDPEELRHHCRSEHVGQTLIDKRVDRSNLSIKMDITDLKCTICETQVKSISALKTHLTTTHQIKFHADVNDYILEFKLTDSPVLNCALCTATYETFKTLLQHMNGHYRNFICEVCDMGFVNQHRLRSHQRTHELGAFSCRRCDKVFSTRVRRSCHEKYTHNTTARYTTTCPQCDQSFTSYYRRNRHMREAHNAAAASYRCNVCDKTFILKSKLTSHIKKVHLMERNHICSVCGRGFFIKQSLDEHMVKHNGERVFECTVCHKAYARKKTLREHMRIHNNDRRFKCALCGLAFVQKCSLKSHMLSNHGVTLSQYESTTEATAT